MRSQRKGTKAQKMRKADKIFSEKIRAKGYCELKGLDRIECSDALQTMHIVGRANKNLRWDQINALCGCSGHHFYYTNNPTEFAMVIYEKFPDRFEYLKEHRNKIWDKDIDRVLEELENWRPSGTQDW